MYLGVGAMKGWQKQDMMTVKITGTALTVLLFGCVTRHENKNYTRGDSTNVHEVIANKQGVDSLKTSAGADYSDCIRGKAEPVTRKSVYPNAMFQLNSDNHTGTEIVDLGQGEILTITNSGCEYFVLTFRFETERFLADTSNTIYWLSKAAVLMNDVENGIEAPLDLKGGIEAIPLYLSSMDNRSYNLGDEIVIREGDIRDFMTLDRIQKINDKRFAIEISYAKGPL